jgi:hypothetical protein
MAGELFKSFRSARGVTQGSDLVWACLQADLTGLERFPGGSAIAGRWIAALNPLPASVRSTEYGVAISRLASSAAGVQKAFVDFPFS